MEGQSNNKRANKKYSTKKADDNNLQRYPYYKILGWALQKATTNNIFRRSYGLAETVDIYVSEVLLDKEVIDEKDFFINSTAIEIIDREKIASLSKRKEQIIKYKQIMERENI